MSWYYHLYCHLSVSWYYHLVFWYHHPFYHRLRLLLLLYCMPCLSCQILYRSHPGLHLLFLIMLLLLQLLFLNLSLHFLSDWKVIFLLLRSYCLMLLSWYYLLYRHLPVSGYYLLYRHLLVSGYYHLCCHLSVSGYYHLVFWYHHPFYHRLRLLLLLYCMPCLSCQILYRSHPGLHLLFLIMLLLLQLLFLNLSLHFLSDWKVIFLLLRSYCLMLLY